MEKAKKETNVLQILSNLVEIPSYGKIGKDHQIIEYLKEAFKESAEIVELEDKNGNIHLLIGVNHELKDIDNSIILSGHIDTVTATPGHNSSITLNGDYLTGLGTSDMKAFSATLIANLEHLKSMKVPIIISLTSDEETNLRGIELITKELQERNIHTDLIVVGEPTDLDYYVSSRGNSINVSIFKGKTAHSGTPELGINAIELTGDFMQEIKKVSKAYESVAATCITSVTGGKSPSNVVPDESSLCFGIRTSDRKVLNKMLEILHQKHEEIIKVKEGSVLFNVLDIPPFERRESEFLSVQAYQNQKRMIDAPYATEAGYFQNIYPSSDIVIYGPGNPDCIHKPGEAISITNLLQYDSELLVLIRNYLEYKGLIKQDTLNLTKGNNKN